jgi:protein involved in polysaccharide export with SLBB domain
MPPLARLRRVVLAGALLAVGCTSALPRDPAFAPAPAPGAPRSFSLRPGDVVRTKVWREPELGGDIPVEADGTAVFPLVGPVPVLGIGRDSLERLLSTRLARSIKDPAVTLQFVRRTPVGAGVRMPGLYPVDPTMTFADVLALAGGASPEARPDVVQVIRNGRLLLDDVSPSLFVSQVELAPGDVIVLPTRSWWSRNALVTVTVAQSLVFVLLSAVQIAILTR